MLSLTPDFALAMLVKITNLMIASQWVVCPIPKSLVAVYMCVLRRIEAPADGNPFSVISKSGAFALASTLALHHQNKDVQYSQYTIRNTN
jgi:hypothetical protein